LKELEGELRVKLTESNQESHWTNITKSQNENFRNANKQKKKLCDWGLKEYCVTPDDVFFILFYFIFSYANVLIFFFSKVGVYVKDVHDKKLHENKNEYPKYSGDGEYSANRYNAWERNTVSYSVNGNSDVFEIDEDLYEDLIYRIVEGKKKLSDDIHESESEDVKRKSNYWDVDMEYVVKIENDDIITENDDSVNFIPNPKTILEKNTCEESDSASDCFDEMYEFSSYFLYEGEVFFLLILL
jgi:hypothetical protein